MKKTNLWLFAAILTCGLGMLLASCSDDDNSSDPLSETEQQKAEFRKSLLGLQVDLSDIFMGGDDIILWMLNEDDTFELMCLSEVAREGQEDSLAIDCYEGRWEAFVNADDPYVATSEKLNGFKATFTIDNEYLSDEEVTLTYYAESAEDESGEPLLIMFNSVAIDYLTMVDYGENSEARSMTRGFTNDIFKKNKEKVEESVKKVKKAFGSTFGTISYSDRLSALSKKECQKFHEEASSALKTMLSDFNASQTNYAEWMTEIYTKNGENPRICDMNIPGTHDTFTYYYWKGSYVGPGTRWCVTQPKSVSGQWEAGARVFDFRLKYDDKDENMMGLYHLVYLKINFKDALQEIVDQLDKHPGEMAIASLAIEGSNKSDYPTLTQKTLKEFADKGKIVMNPAPDVRLNDCKGKIIVVYSTDYDSKRSELYGPVLYIGSGNQYSKSMLVFPKDGKTMDVTMTYQNLYEQSGTFFDKESNSTFWRAKKEFFEMCFWEFQKYRKIEDTVWSWNQLNAYIGNYATMSYSQNAEVMHPWGVNFVLQHKNSPLGIITMDFIGTNEKWEGYWTNCETLPKIIVETNRYQ